MLEPTQRKNIIAILGMDRSGTSCIAKGLHDLGLNLGNNLMQAGPDNPKGFWEDNEIVKINSAILTHLGLSWDSLKWMENNDPLIHDSFYGQAKYLLTKRFQNTNLYGFKDPRTVGLLTFWKKIFADLDLDDKYVIAIRNPLSVANSLKKRNHFIIEKSILLWLKSVINAIAKTENKKRVIVEYDVLLENPSSELKRIAEQLDCNFVLKEEILHNYINGFLDKNLKHHSFDMAQLKSQSEILPFSVEVYQWLCQLSGNENSFNDKECKKTWEDIKNRFNSYAFLYHYFDAHAKIYNQNENFRTRLLKLEMQCEQQAKLINSLNKALRTYTLNGRLKKPVEWIYFLFGKKMDMA